MVAPGLLDGARATGSGLLLGGGVRRLRGAVHRPGARVRARARRRREHGRRGGACSLAYSLGLAVPFVAAGIVFARAMGAFRWLRDHYRSSRS